MQKYIYKYLDLLKKSIVFLLTITFFYFFISYIFSFIPFNYGDVEKSLTKKIKYYKIFHIPKEKIVFQGHGITLSRDTKQRDLHKNFIIYSFTYVFDDNDTLETTTRSLVNAVWNDDNQDLYIARILNINNNLYLLYGKLDKQISDRKNLYTLLAFKKFATLHKKEKNYYYFKPIYNDYISCKIYKNIKVEHTSPIAPISRDYYMKLVHRAINIAEIPFYYSRRCDVYQNATDQPSMETLLKIPYYNSSIPYLSNNYNLSFIYDDYNISLEFFSNNKKVSIKEIQLDNYLSNKNLIF